MCLGAQNDYWLHICSETVLDIHVTMFMQLQSPLAEDVHLHTGISLIALVWMLRTFFPSQRATVIWFKPYTYFGQREAFNVTLFRETTATVSWAKKSRSPNKITRSLTMVLFNYNSLKTEMSYVFSNMGIAWDSMISGKSSSIRKNM